MRKNTKVRVDASLLLESYSRARAILSLAVFACLVLSQNVQADAPPEKDMQSIFNGKDLTGWDGDPRLWSVKNGVIHGETTAEQRTKGNTFLIWKDGVTKDFDLRLSFRCTATNNSGIQYRSKHITQGRVRNKWVVRGYQHEIRNENKLPSVAGFIYDEGGGRGRMCLVGEKATGGEDGKKKVTRTLIDAPTFRKLFKIDDWNEVVIVARGGNLQHYLNNTLILDCTDNHPQRALREGILALQLHGGKPMWTEFKNIRIRHLPADGSHGAFTADWESLKKHNSVPEWFRDAKFGIYFHWGVYSVPAFGSEWYPRNMHNKGGNRRQPGGSREYKHHVATYGEPTTFGYHDFVPRFKAEKFDAEAWAALFAESGARFAGLVAEHHDGFAMWDSDLTPWNAVDMGPKRDITGELAKAVRKRGMKFVTTFHHARNSLHQIKRNGKSSWTGHYDFLKRDFPTLLDDPKNAILYGAMPREAFLQMWKGKLVEVIDKYQPDMIWFDSWLNEIPDAVKMEYLAYYFNKAREQGKEVVVTFKQKDLPREVALDDYEKGRADRLTDFVWLTDDTVSRGSWCYTNNLRVKSTSEVLRTFIDIVSKNGQLLLNISPKADGTIPENQKEVLRGIGRWLAKYGEAIYDTRPFVEYGEGLTQMEKGGGFSRMKGKYGPQDIRYTRKGNIVYAIVLGWPGEKKPLTMQMFGQKGKAKNIKVEKITMLGTDETIEWERKDVGLVVTTPSKKIDDLAIVFKLRTSG